MKLLPVVLFCVLALPFLSTGVRPGSDPGTGRLNAVSRSVSTPLRVCADPGNLPFSNRAGEGFENRLASMLAADLATTVEYTWWPQRLGFIRNTLSARTCDVVMGYPAAADNVLTTTPYYRSSYVLVTRRDRGLRLSGLDDPRLRRLRIGVQLVGDDGANAPPTHALSRRGLSANLIGFPVYADAGRTSSTIVDAVSAGRVDVAAAWGPTAGYFAARQRDPLVVEPLAPGNDPALPEAFDISMAVRPGDAARLAQLNTFIRRNRDRIAVLLTEYNIPLLPIERSERSASALRATADKPERPERPERSAATR
jgi:mxaJ protein